MNITTTVINKIYMDCLLTMREQYSSDSTTVPGLTHGAHTFHYKRLNAKFTYILSTIKKLPRAMLHSHSEKGVPWIVARSHGSAYDGCTLESTERLLVMGIALGIVRVVSSSTPACDVPYVVIDDDRLIRHEKLKPKHKQMIQVVRWHK